MANVLIPYSSSAHVPARCGDAHAHAGQLAGPATTPANSRPINSADRQAKSVFYLLDRLLAPLKRLTCSIHQTNVEDPGNGRGHWQRTRCMYAVAILHSSGGGGGSSIGGSSS